MKIERSRIKYLLLIAVTILAGLGSRASFVPSFIYPYLGDMLYALMIFFIVGFLFPGLETVKVALISTGICFFIEISQLYQSDWIREIRSYKLGGLILGYGFLWSDLVSYAAGGLAGVVFERFFGKFNTNPGYDLQ